VINENNMRAVLKSLDDGHKEVELPVGKTVLGRGALLDCVDKKVSRNHATIELTDSGDILLTSQHVNPCFYYSSDASSTPKVLKKDITQELNDGDIFSLLASSYKYQVIVESGNRSAKSESNDSKKLDEKSDEESPVNGESDKKDEKNDMKKRRWRRRH